MNAEKCANTAILQANSEKEKAEKKKSEYDNLIASEYKSERIQIDCINTLIQCFLNGKHVSDMIIGTNIKYGIFIHYISITEEKLSLYDSTKLTEVVDGANCELWVSTGLFLPKELAWEVIKEFLETGKASDKIKWISPNDIPEGGNYF